MHNNDYIFYPAGRDVCFFVFINNLVTSLYVDSYHGYVSLIRQWSDSLDSAADKKHTIVHLYMYIYVY